MRNFILAKTTALGIICYCGVATAQTTDNLLNIETHPSRQIQVVAQNNSENIPLFPQETQTPDSEETQTPDSEEIQTPDSEEIQTPDSEEIQTPDSEEIQTPDSEETQTPDSEETQTPDSAENINSSSNPLLFPTKVDEVTADNIQAITLQQAIDLAKNNNKDLQVAQLNLDRTEKQLKEALGSQYPTVSAQMDLTRNDSASSELSIRRAEQRGQSLLDDDSVNTSFNTGLELNYNLYTGGRRGAQIKAAEQQIRFNQLDLERITEQITLDVSTDYYALQGADASVRIEQAAVDEATQSLRDAELLERAGLGTKFDVLRAEVDLASSQQALTIAIAEQKSARRQLVETISLAQNVELMAADPIEVAADWTLSLEQSILLAYKNRAELEQFLLQREIEDQQQLVEISANKPQVSLFANYDVLGVLNDDVGPADGFAIGARLNWNFFDGGIAKARRDQNKVDKNIAETRFSQQRDQIRFEVEDAYFRLEANKTNIDTARKSVELAEESLRLARLRFQAGVGTQLDVIDAQSELTRSRGNLLRAVVTYNQQLASLQRAVSNLPDNRLFDLPNAP